MLALQGPPLADNLRRCLGGEPLRPYAPQSSHLNLISAGNRYAIAVKGSWLGESWMGDVRGYHTCCYCQLWHHAQKLQCCAAPSCLAILSLILCAGLQGAYMWTLKDWIDRKFIRVGDVLLHL